MDAKMLKDKVSSVNGARPFCGATYTSTKGALNTLTKNVAMRLVNTNIRCNAAAPGATITPAHLANKAGEQLTRPMPVCTLPAGWAGPSGDRYCKSATARSCKRGEV